MPDLSPFTPAGDTVTLAVTGTTGRVTLTAKPLAAEITVIVQNIDTQIAFIKLGDATVEATTASMPIQPGAAVTLSTSASKNTHLAAITGTGTTTLYVTSGTGIPYGFGGAAISGGAGGEDVNVAAWGGTATTLGIKTPSASVPVVEPDGQLVPSASVTSAATIATITDTSGYESVTVQVTSAGSGCTITYETSEDGTNWLPTSGIISTQAGATAATTTSATVGMWTFQIKGIGFRYRVSTYGSGTVTAIAHLRKNPQLLSNRVTADGPNNIGSGSGAGTVFQIAVRSATSVIAAAAQNLNLQPLATGQGVLINQPYAPPEVTWSYAAASGGITDTSDVVLAAAGAASVRNYLTRLDLINTDTTVGTEVVVKDGSTVIWRTFIPASTAAVTQPMPVNFVFPTPLRGSAATAMNAACITTSSQTYINASGFQAP